MDTVTTVTILLWAFSLAVLYVFARFTLKLIRQHYDIYPLLYEFEEADKKKEDGGGGE